MELSSRHLLRRCKRSLAAIAGRSWILVAACAAGRSTATSAKMNLLARASSGVGRVQLLSSTLTPTHESLIDVKPFSVRLNLHGDLNFFLGSKAHRRSVERNLTEKTSVKDVIESCGIPHPEVDLILIKGKAVDFNYAVTDDADIAVYPPGIECPDSIEKRLQVYTISR